jgi:hypothetical protein
MREIRVVKTPFTTRYNIPMNERVESLIHMKQYNGSMILIFINDFPGVKEILRIDSRDGTNEPTEMVGGTQERREDYRVHESIKTQLLL